MRNDLMLSLVCVSMVVLVSGCGGQKVDANKPIDQVSAEAQQMTVSDLQSMVKSYQGAIEAKKADIEKLQAKIKEIPLTQLMGEEAKKLKDDLSEITTAIGRLSERMSVYVKELQAKGESLK